MLPTMALAHLSWVCDDVVYPCALRPRWRTPRRAPARASHAVGERGGTQFQRERSPRPRLKREGPLLVAAVPAPIPRGWSAIPSLGDLIAFAAWLVGRARRSRQARRPTAALRRNGPDDAANPGQKTTLNPMVPFMA